LFWFLLLLYVDNCRKKVFIFFSGNYQFESTIVANKMKMKMGWNFFTSLVPYCRMGVPCHLEQKISKKTFSNIWLVEEKNVEYNLIINQDVCFCVYYKQGETSVWEKIPFRETLGPKFNKSKRNTSCSICNSIDQKYCFFKTCDQLRFVWSLNSFSRMYYPSN
jgi:hypothetical protein